ncbi:MAG: menaquinone biosynthesis decarboxylase [Prevotellaceae bacterium]|jgi:4-hydroxy-3-polyprenylbenzoate decarboxylase|nr:menaquinone biosynthesis decarboxylase [Prevotellaceae bacterium]
MYYDLIGYIEHLEARGELIVIDERVDPVLEIAEVTDRIAKSGGGGKALLFKNTGTLFPVLTNAFGSDKRIACALGLSTIDDLNPEFDALFGRLNVPGLNLWDKLKILPLLNELAGFFPKIASIKVPQCREVVMPSPKLGELPALKCWPHDGGRFLTLPLVHTKNPSTGMRNLGMYRVQIFDDTSAAMHWHRHKTGARHFEEYRKAGKLMPVAVSLGGDPVYTWCATAPLPENVDEYLLAGFIRKKPVRLVKCLTQDLEVPEDSDFVIEGYIDPHEAPVSEGPFGDHTGFYSLRDLYPLMHVTCITYRKGAVFPATVTGIPPQEDSYMAKAAERIFLKPIQMVVAPEIADIYLPPEGVAHNIAVVAINKTYPGQAMKVAGAMWGAGQMMFCKAIVVVDSDIDIRNSNAVVDTVTRYWNPAADTCFGKGPLDVLDHAARQPGFGGKICIDATRKLPEEERACVAVPFENTYLFCNESSVPTKKAKLTVIFDDEIDVADTETCVWIAGNNTDVAYDCEIKDNVLIVDARSKWKRKDFSRPWPNIVCMDSATIASVDAKWPKLGAGAFLPSPSLRYRHLAANDSAQIENKQ